jgi:hypothetical protein
MTIFFDLNKIIKDSNNSTEIIFKLLKKHYEQNLAKYIGSSFLLNCNDLLSDNNDSLFKLQYLQLAAKRNYGMYKMFHVKTLDLSLYPDLIYKTIILNPLLTITGNEMHFLYEETTRKKKWH